MTKKDVTNSVLDKIKKGEVKATPKWQFLLKEYARWIILGLVLLVSAIAAAVSFFRIETNDWDLHERLEQSQHIFFLRNLPYFWIGLLIVFALIAYIDFRHTKKGYKISLPLAILGTALISIALGFMLFRLGAAERLEHRLHDMPFYHDPRVDNWDNSEYGLLAGEIIEILDNKNFTLETFKNEQWTIVLEEENTDRLEPGRFVGIFGEEIGEFTFEAEKIRPWKGNVPPKKGPKPGSMMHPPKKVKENVRPLRTN